MMSVKRFAWTLAPMLIAAGVAMYMINRQSVNDQLLDKSVAGVCLDDGRVLTQEELTTRIRRSFVRGLVDESIYMNSEVWAGSFRVALIYGYDDIHFF